VSDHDLLSGDTSTTIVAAKTDAPVGLVADGIMWRGTPVPRSSCPRKLPRRPTGRTPLRDRLTVRGYVHLERGCCRLGERWAPSGQVHLRLDSVRARWLRGTSRDGPAHNTSIATNGTNGMDGMDGTDAEAAR
jgi:hypothetical protein